ncbi:MAG: (2Fe-2S)-binding protein [Planctomycetaceae bacterium]|nr:(2Fe-2S)-binding protein [Planctomycetaceae bacterium]
MGRERRPAGEESRFNRRAFLKGSGAAMAASAWAGTQFDTEAADEPKTYQKNLISSEAGEVRLTVNGQEYKLMLEPRVTLLDALRNDLKLTGAKEVEETTAAGADTVLIDGKPVLANSRLAVECQGKQITTIEALTGDNAIVQEFVKQDALQCGFCIPGFVMALKGLLEQNPNPNEKEIASALGGNLCRCGTYANIKASALELARRGGAN